MTSTSSTYSRHRKRGGRKRKSELKRRSSDVLIYSEDDEKEPNLEDGQWSSNKLKQEMSSFIAEFSYLTEARSSKIKPESKLQSNTNKPQQSFQVYAARKGDMSSPFLDSDDKKKGVEWKDKQRGAKVYSVQEVCRTLKATCRPSRARVVKKSGFKCPPKIKVTKNRSRRRSTSRDLSCPPRASTSRRVRRGISGFRAAKSPNQRRRARSSVSEMPMRRRVRSKERRRTRSRTRSCSTSYVKYMPFQFKRKRTKEIIVKRSKPKIIYKTIEPCQEPTLITLFPKTIKRRTRRLRSTEPEIPCQCDMCTYKYRSLARLCRDPCFNRCANSYRPVRAPMCDPCAPSGPPYSTCVPRCRPWRNHSPCSPNWCYTGRPGASRWCPEEYCQPLASKCVKSVCFKYGAMGPCVDSNITHYFHSILSRGAFC